MENILWIRSYNEWVWVLEETVKRLKLTRRIKLYDYD